MTIELAQLDGTFVLDPTHTRIGFSTRHAMVTKVRGSFNAFQGTASTKPGLEDATISVAIETASVDTRNNDRDAHLRSADFFESEKYPNITFASTEITAPDSDVLRVTGDLTIRDVTRAVTIDFEYQGSVIDPWGNTRLGLEGSVVVNRKDFNLTWNAALEAGGVLVSERVTLEFEVAAVKQS